MMFSSGEPNNEKAYFPQKLLPQLERYTRVNRAATQLSLLNPSTSGGRQMKKSGTLPDLPTSFSPSSIRRLNHTMASKRVHINLCYLGKKQVIGKFYKPDERNTS